MIIPVNHIAAGMHCQVSVFLNISPVHLLVIMCSLHVLPTYMGLNLYTLPAISTVLQQC